MDRIERAKLGLCTAAEMGQDLIEYTLLLAFVVTISSAIFVVSGNDLRTIWAAGANTLNAARHAAGV